MTRTFQFLFDVGGPNGYLVHRVLPAFCAEHGAIAEYVPVLLGGLFKATGNRPPLMRYADAPAKWAYEQLEFSRFIKAHGLTRFRMNPNFPPNSLQAMRAITGAAALGCQAEVIEAFMTGVWEQELNLGDRDALQAHLDASGLDGAALLARADGRLTLPACYYEFAQRYPDAGGQLFEGFIPESANRIFESTHRR